jgi:hypothetical protein
LTEINRGTGLFSQGLFLTEIFHQEQALVMTKLEQQGAPIAAAAWVNFSLS